MKLKWTGTRFEFESRYEEKDVPKEARFRWDPVSRCWWTSDVAIASKLAQYADPDARKKIEADIETHHARIEASRAMDSNVEIPAPPGCEYRGFQKAGIAFCLARPRVLLADEMGTGKSVEALGVVNADPTLRRVIVVCPATIRENWKREATKWLVRPMRTTVIDEAMPWPTDDGLTIVNYDRIYQRAKKGEKRVAKKDVKAVDGALGPWDLAVIDESQAIKDARSLRGRIVKQICAASRRVLLLTGTPMLNRPIELWHPLQILDPEVWNNWHRYVTRFCDAKQTRWGWDVSGASHIEELGSALRGSGLMLRRLKEDVLLELPPKQRQIIDIKNGTREDSSRYEDAIRELELAAGQEGSGYGDAVSRLSEARRAIFTEMARVRHETALKKVPYVIEHVQGLLEGGEAKCAVWFHHHDVGDAIADALAEYGVARIDGRTKNEDRMAECDRFQTDPNVRVFVGGISAAGVGITLTAARTAVFAELDWVPGVISQAEDRHHRLSQKDSVLIQHVVLDGSIDARLARTLVRKQEIIERTLDRKTEEKIELAAEDPEARILAANRKASSERPAKRATRNEKQEQRDFTPAQVEAINLGLRKLAGLCDGARSVDGAGFSKMDAEFGRSLAEGGARSPRQIFSASLLLRRYRRQIPEEYAIVFGGEA